MKETHRIDMERKGVRVMAVRVMAVHVLVCKSEEKLRAKIMQTNNI